MRIEEIKYDEDRHFYYWVRDIASREFYQPMIDRFMLHKLTDHGFIWVDIFNRLGQCNELPKEWARKRQELFQFVGHARMLRIFNKYAITEEDKQVANRAMKTFKSEFSALVKPEASFSVRCRYTLGLF